jgi:hypothetical protein
MAASSIARYRNERRSRGRAWCLEALGRRNANRSERKRNDNGTVDRFFETIVFLYEWLGAKVSDKACGSGFGVSGSQPETRALGLVDQAKRPLGMSIPV